MVGARVEKKSKKRLSIRLATERLREKKRHRERRKVVERGRPASRQVQRGTAQWPFLRALGPRWQQAVAAPLDLRVLLEDQIE